jgi:hypothetical protein
VFFVLREEFQALGDSGLRFVFPPKLIFDLLEDFVFVDTIVRLILYVLLL